MELDKAVRNPKFAGKLNILLVSLGGVEDARQFVASKKIVNLKPFAGRPPSDYGIRYIPHKVLIDKDGVVVENFQVSWHTVERIIQDNSMDSV
eukprot:SAG31_NODE_882_length_11260_cov_3.357104_2_plen_93_part_00